MTRLERAPNGYRIHTGEPPPTPTEHALVLRAMFRPMIPADQIDAVLALATAVTALAPIDPVPVLTHLAVQHRQHAHRPDTTADASSLAAARAAALETALTALDHPQAQENHP